MVGGTGWITPPTRFPRFDPFSWIFGSSAADRRADRNLDFQWSALLLPLLRDRFLLTMPPVTDTSPLSHLEQRAVRKERPFSDDIELMRRAIETCETREALSASLLGSCMAEWIDPLLGSPQPNGDPASLLPTSQAVTPPLATAELELVGPVAPADVLQPAGEVETASGSGSADLWSQASWLGDPASQSRPLDGTGQTVAIIDTGIAYDHVSLGGGYGPGYRVLGGWDFAENDADPYDDAPGGYHGTHVAGIAAGGETVTADGTFRGIAPGSDLVALRVFDDFGNGNLQWIESALQWVHDNQDAHSSPITTVNLSLGTVLTDANRDFAMSMLEDELQSLFEDDILVFAATGNGFSSLSDSVDPVMYPASSSWVTGVGSIDAGGSLSSFSQRESGILVAEGEAVRSAVPEHVFGLDGDPNDFALLSGTSMATPQISGASMLVRQAMLDAGLDPTATDILQRMQDTAESRIDPSTGSLYYIMDLEAATSFPTSTDEPLVPEGEQPSADDDADSSENLVTEFIGTDESEQWTLDLRPLSGSGESGASGASGGADESGSSGGSTWVRLTNQDGQEFRLGTEAQDDTQPWLLDARGGGDSLQVIGSDQNERLTLRPATATEPSRLVFAGGEVTLRGFEQVRFEGGGGSDRATLFDSPGDDVFQSRDGQATLTGVGYQFEIQQVADLYVHATAGGSDTAHLSDTADDDQLVIRPQFSSIRGGGEFRAAFGFEEVYAYAEVGGHDQADLSDSQNDDVLSISANRSLLSTAGYRATAIGFEDVTAEASRGGNDIVRIFVNDPTGVWTTTDTLTQWSDGNITRLARGFETAEAIERFETLPSDPQGVSGSSQSASATGQADAETARGESFAAERAIADERYLESLRHLFASL